MEWLLPGEIVDIAIIFLLQDVGRDVEKGREETKAVWKR